VGAFTPEIEKAWKIVFTFIISRMREGIRLHGLQVEDGDYDGLSDISPAISGGRDLDVTEL